MDTASTLGVVFEAGGGGSITISQGKPSRVTSWSAAEEDRLASVERALTRIGRHPLSLIGKGLGLCCYGTSKTFYHLEFRPPIPVEKRDRIDSAISHCLADKRRGGNSPPFFAIGREVAAGRPKHGGLGLFPWGAHISARQARWAAKLLVAPLSVAWAGLLRALVFDFCGPAAHPLSLFDISPGLQETVVDLRPLPATVGQVGGLGPWRDVPAVLARLAMGCRALGPVQRLVAADEVQGDGAPVVLGGLELQAPFPDTWSPLVCQRVVHAQRVAGAVSTLGWKPAGGRKWCVSILPGDGQAPRGGPRGPLSLSVRNGTRLQMVSQCEAPRHAKWLKFVAAAKGLHHDGELPVAAGAGAAPTPADHDDRAQWPEPKDSLPLIGSIFKRVWALDWCNSKKEILWRLVLHGIPTAVRLGMHLRRCPCGQFNAAPFGRPHCFWSCPIAAAVIEQIQGALPRGPHGRIALSRDHIWLFVCPQPGIHQLLWDVICLSALGAMDHGRRVLAKLSLNAAAQQPIPQQGEGADADPDLGSSDGESSESDSDGSAASNEAPVDRRPRWPVLRIAQRRAIAAFWRNLIDFCGTTSAADSITFDSDAARDAHPLLRLVITPVPRERGAGVGAGAARAAPRADAGAADDPPPRRRFRVLLPPGSNLPQRADLREHSFNRPVSGPSQREIFHARALDGGRGPIIPGAAATRYGVVNNMVFCACGSWRSAFLRAADVPRHVLCWDD